MNEWIVERVTDGKQWHCDSRSEAQSKVDEFGDVMELTIISPDDGQDEDPEAASDGGVVEPVQTEQTETETETVEAYDLPDKPPVDTDPLTWMPGEFVDTIDGTVAINRKGFSVLKQHYDIDVSSDCIIGPEENDFSFCRVKAQAVTPEGTVSEAHGSAHVDRGDDPWLLLEMADTRAKKRALSDATGVGMLAVEELMNKP